MTTTIAASDRWPSLEGAGAGETRQTLFYWGQILGKTRLALSPMVNHWWQAPFYVSARGLTTSPIPCGDFGFDMEIDLISHRLVMRASHGGTESMDLCDGPLSQLYGQYLARLAKLGVELTIDPLVVEIPERVRLDEDDRVCRYDGDWANRFFRTLVQVDQVFKAFRGEFVGKASPVHFFWGGFDLAASRFSGRRAPPHPGGVPHVGDWVMREAYSHEVSSAGFWPGDARFPEPAFYAYAYPEPVGFAEAAVRPPAARYERTLGEFVLPYASVRASASPASDVRAFLDSTYAAAAELARWDRAALERPASHHQAPPPSDRRNKR